MNAFGIENFSINDHQQTQVRPGHSPYISPRLIPQQNHGLGMGPDFMLQQAMPTHMPRPGLEIYTTQSEESFRNMSHARHASVVSDMGQADQFPAPTINIEPAPVSRQASFEPERDNLGDNLSPPTSMFTPSVGLLVLAKLTDSRGPWPQQIRPTRGQVIVKAGVSIHLPCRAAALAFAQRSFGQCFSQISFAWIGSTVSRSLSRPSLRSH